MRISTLLLIAVAASPALAGDALAGDIKIADAWARETIPSAKAGASFMAIHNMGNNPDRLIAAASPVASNPELHTHIKDGDIMRMREVEGGIEVPPGQMTMLQPGGLHVMLMGLNGQLEEGATFPLVLIFEQAGEITVQVEIKDISHQGGAHKH